eukprot:14029274-Ditylum_brightwellii.AAC.1
MLGVGCIICGTVSGGRRYGSCAVVASFGSGGVAEVSGPNTFATSAKAWAIGSPLRFGGMLFFDVFFKI